MIEQLFAGIGLGMLTGLLIGLSSSPVVASVVGALAAGMITLLGFSPSSGENATVHLTSSAWRLGSFGLSCAGAVILGLTIRTHNWFTPSIGDQVAALTRSGFSENEARKWVAYRNLGMSIGAESAPDSSKKDAGPRAGAGVGSSALFGSGGADECQHFDPDRYKDTHEHLKALRILDGKYAAFAAQVSAMDDARQKRTLDAVKRLFCAE